MENLHDTPEFVTAREVAKNIDDIYQTLGIPVDAQEEVQFSLVDSLLGVMPNQIPGLRDKITYYLAINRGTRYPSRRT